MIEINSESALSDLLESNTRAMVQFSAPWCGPCRAVAPHIDRLERENSVVAMAKLDIDRAQDVAAKFRVTSVPTFIFFSNGAEVDRISGANVEDVSRAVSKLASLPDSGHSDDSEQFTAVGTPIPRGCESLNSTINFGSAELLNVESPDPGKQLRVLLGRGSPLTSSDADSQLLIYLPLHNKVMVHSLLIKVSPDHQPPNHVKVWASLPGPLSFEDAAVQKALYDGPVGPANSEGWCTVQVRYVLFQNVTSVLVFLTGEDDDEPSVAQQLVLVGRMGDTVAAGSLNEDEPE